MQRVAERLQRGESLAAALRAQRGFLPPLLCEMVDVGERTGRLEEVLLRLAEHYDRLVRLQRLFLAGIAWPLIELALGLAVVGILIWVLGAVGAEWNGRPMSVLGLYGTRGLLIYVTILGLIGGALAWLILALRQGWIPSEPIFRVLTVIPGIGTALKTMALSRLTWSLAIATDSDLDAQRAVELAVRSTQNAYYTSRLDRIRDVIGQRRSFYEAFVAAGIFPDDFLDALHTGETAGRISETMATVARQYEDRAKMAYRMLAVFAGLVVLLLVFAIMIFFIFQLLQLYLMPIYDTLETM